MRRHLLFALFLAKEKDDLQPIHLLLLLLFILLIYSIVQHLIPAPLPSPVHPPPLLSHPLLIIMLIPAPAAPPDGPAASVLPLLPLPPLIPPFLLLLAFLLFYPAFGLQSSDVCTAAAEAALAVHHMGKSSVNSNTVLVPDCSLPTLPGQGFRYRDGYKWLNRAGIGSSIYLW